MPNTFSFDGTRKDYIKAVKKELPIFAPVERILQYIPKRAGALLMGTTTDVRMLNVTIFIEKTDNITFPKLKEDLATWLVTDEVKELKFDDELDRTYYAVITEISDFTKLNHDKATVELTFMCPDSYKYSDERRILMPSNSATKSYNIDNLGNVDTYPITRLNVKKKLNYFSLISIDNYLQIGTPETVDVPTYEPETLVFSDNCTTTSGWSSSGLSVDNGYVVGQILSSGQFFYGDTFGTVIQPVNWQGGSLKKSISKPLKNFRARINVHFWNKPEFRTGMCEIYFLNSSSEVVAKIGLEDRFAATNNILAKAGLGGTSNRTWIYSGGADNPEYWDDYSGIMEIKRVNNYWTVYWSTVDANYNHTYPRGSNGSLNFNDIGGVYADDITQIQVAFRIYPDTERADMAIHDINIWELNDKPVQASLPIVALAGDILEIDHYKNIVRKNGEVVMGLKDFGSNFFPLKAGSNRLTFQPSDAGDVTLTYRERFL